MGTSKALPEEEIVRSFRNRDCSEERMVKILAELHAVRVNDIAAVLRGRGIIDNMPFEGESGGGSKVRFEWTEERNERLRALAEQGATLANAADELGVTRAAVQCHARRIDIRFQSPQAAEAVKKPAVPIELPAPPKQKSKDIQQGFVLEEYTTVFFEVIMLAVRLFGGPSVSKTAMDIHTGKYFEVMGKRNEKNYRLRLEEVPDDE